MCPRPGILGGPAMRPWTSGSQVGAGRCRVAPAGNRRAFAAIAPPRLERLGWSPCLARSDLSRADNAPAWTDETASARTRRSRSAAARLIPQHLVHALRSVRGCGSVIHHPLHRVSRGRVMQGHVAAVPRLLLLREMAQACQNVARAVAVTHRHLEASRGRLAALDLSCRVICAMI